MTLKRSFLFVPGNNERFNLLKAFQTEADSIILDLEDAVATSEKEKARDLVISAVNNTHNKCIYVRINSVTTLWWEADMKAVIKANVDGIVLPKAEMRR